MNSKSSPSLPLQTLPNNPLNSFNFRRFYSPLNATTTSTNKTFAHHHHLNHQHQHQHNNNDNNNNINDNFIYSIFNRTLRIIYMNYPRLLLLLVFFTILFLGMSTTIPSSSSAAISTTNSNHVGFEKFKSYFPLETIQPLYLPSSQSPSQQVFQLTGKTMVVNSQYKYPPVRQLSARDRKRILVTGGSGFVGSHLVDRLMLMGHQVFVVDNFFTGDRKNIEHWENHPNFKLIIHDVVNPLELEVDQIYHLACPASPPHYQYNPIKTLKTSFVGTMNMLGLAKRVKARFLLTSTSEVYGDPEEHPQRETYWGHVNPIGPRACYDEGKRAAETLTYSYAKQDGVDVRVARIFNTFGPRMNENDGRVVSNFIIQAIQNEPITVYGPGKQTRSFQYVHDLVDGLIALMESNYSQPVNLGNPEEFSIDEFASVIKDLVKSDSEIVMKEKTEDDPQKRKPDITVAQTELGWSPKFPAKQGLLETIDYFRYYLKTFH